MKPIIATDLAGSLLKNEVVKKAHEQWFEIMDFLLNDNTVRELAGKPDFFKYVDVIMERFTGLKAANSEEKKLINLFARNLFQMCYLSAVDQNSYHKDYADFLKSLKTKYQLFLITTTPENIIEAVLNKIGCSFFDKIVTNKIYEEPDKEMLFRNLKEKPLFYISESDQHFKTCKKLEIKTIMVTWEKKQDWENEVKEKPDYRANTVDELKKIIIPAIHSAAS